MELTLQGLKNAELWEKAGIKLPQYNIENVVENTKNHLYGYTLVQAIFLEFLLVA